MKKKQVSMLLLVALLLTGCGQDKQVVTPTYDWMESGVSISAESFEEASDEASAEEKEGETSGDVTKEEESTEESSNEPAPEKEVVNTPDALSDNLYDYQISINGEVLQFPMWYEDFTALGWEYVGDPADTLDAMSYYSYVVFAKDGAEFNFVTYNYGINAMPISESLVCGISVDEWDMDEIDAEIVLPGGVSYGVSTLADLEAAYGAPKDSYEGTYYTEYTYQENDDYYCRIRLEVSTETGVLSAVDMQNLIDLEGIAEEANLFYDETPQAVTDYVAPGEMSADFKAYTVTIDNVLFAVPAPLSVLLADGWAVDDEIEIIPGKWTEYLYLVKGEERLSVTIINPHPNAVAIANTMIYDVEVSSYNVPKKAVFAAGIEMGMTEDDLLAALEGQTYESSDYDTSRVYNMELEDDYNTSYSVWVRDGVIDQVGVSYRAPYLFE